MINVEIEVVESIIIETSSMPRNLVKFYNNLPGMSPSSHFKKMSKIVSNLEEDDAKLFISDVVDSTLFLIFHLMDVNFKDKNIQTSFCYQEKPNQAPFGILAEIYRSKVSPGGSLIE